MFLQGTKLEDLNAALQAEGLVMNTSGGVSKVSPDGLLWQSSTTADNVEFRFQASPSALLSQRYGCGELQTLWLARTGR